MEGIIGIIVVAAVIFAVIIFALLGANNNSQNNTRIPPDYRNNYVLPQQYDTQTYEYYTQEIALTRYQRAQALTSIQTKPLLNKEEQKIFGALLKLIKDKNRSLSVNPQVSFNSFVKYDNRDKDAFRVASALSVDFLLSEKSYNGTMKPIAVIEYHGGGHYPQDSKLNLRTLDNDRTKKYLCERMNILFVVLDESDILNIANALEEKAFTMLSLA